LGRFSAREAQKHHKIFLKTVPDNSKSKKRRWVIRYVGPPPQVFSKIKINASLFGKLPARKMEDYIDAVESVPLIEEVTAARDNLDSILQDLFLSGAAAEVATSFSDFAKVQNLVALCEGSDAYLKAIRGAEYPLRVPVRAFVKEGNAIQASLQQSQKDFDRDVVEVNLELQSETDRGYDRAVAMTKGALQRAKSVLLEAEAEVMAKEVLQHACRTQSSGDALDVMFSIFAKPELAVLAPSSSEAEAVKLTIKVGKWGNFWGLGVMIEVPTVYRVCDPDPKDEDSSVWERLRVTYRRALYFRPVEDSSAVDSRYELATEDSPAPLVEVTLMDFGMGDALSDPEEEENEEEESEDEDEDDEDDEIDEDEAALEAENGNDWAGSLSTTIQRLQSEQEQALIEQGSSGGDAAVMEVYSWGRGENGVLGLPDARAIEPRPQKPTFDAVFGLTRISGVSCSLFHTIFLTDIGLAYSCGHGQDGALGHGDQEMCAVPRLIDWFGVQSPPVLLKQVACGADLAGAHSVAVTDSGRVYSWGLGSALGTSSPVSQPTPQLVQGALRRLRVSTVDCGGCLTVAVTTKGRVFSWGRWANGRLGIGLQPKPTAAESKRSMFRRQVLRFQLHPAEVLLRRKADKTQKTGEGDEAGEEADKRSRRQRWRVRSVACGEAHVLAVDVKGGVWAWGSNADGQLGNGDTVDYPWPCRVFVTEQGDQNDEDEGEEADDKPNETAQLNRMRSALGMGLGRGLGAHGGRMMAAMERRSLAVGSIACGTSHSLAVDTEGRVWTWGADGHSSITGHSDLAHFSHPISGVMGGSMSNLRRRKLMQRQRRAEGLPALPWTVPRRVRCIGAGPGMKVAMVSAGSVHSLAVTTTGELYRWGLPDHGVLGDGRNMPLPVPTMASPSLVPGLGEQCVTTVAAGAWHSVALTKGITHLGKEFLVALQDCDDAEVRQGIFGGSGASGAGATSDIALLVAGRLIYAHKLVLAQRSTVLRSLITEEERPGHAVELFLPELRFEVAQTMVEYIYSDNIGTRLDPSTPLPQDLMLAARKYGLPRLEAICRQALLAGKSSALAMPGEEDEEQDDEDELGPDAPPDSTLAYDLSGALGDQHWADVCFLADNKPVYAHKCVLMARSEYFAAMFRSSMAESETQRMTGMAEVVVPDSHVVMLRILLYVYSGAVAATSDQALMEDMVAADRYGLLRMKLLCENMITVTTDNCAQILELSDLVQTPRLKELALHFITDRRHVAQVEATDDDEAHATTNLAKIAQTDGFSSLQKRAPHMMTMVLRRLQNQSQLALQQKLERDFVLKQQEVGNEEFMEKQPVPIVPLLLVIAAAYAYAVVSKYTMLGNLVPALNIVALAGAFAAGIYGLAS
jgi:alpha-tubulin suppressor-like RCC1 family protein